MTNGPISNATFQIPASKAGTFLTEKPGAMGKDDFLKLLIAQLKHQDPTAPTDMAAMTQQMTQFSMLEQMTNMSSALTRTEALALLGREVSYAAPNGAVKTGVVEHVDMSNGKPTLTIGGQAGILDSMIKGVK